MLAALEGSISCMQLILAAHDPAAQVTAVDKQGRNSLMLAAGGGRIEAVELLLDQPCMREQLEAADEKGGTTALMFACDRCQSACVRLLLAAGHAAAQVQASNK
jgi:ankyrin repeat protein